MLRTALSSLHSFHKCVVGPLHSMRQLQLARSFSALISKEQFGGYDCGSILKNCSFGKHPSSVFKLPSPIVLGQQSRSVTKFSLGKGKRQTVRSVTARFRRLDWGIWIRRIAGSHKKLWKKTNGRRMRLERHVFIPPARSYMLDKMVSLYWRTPKYWVDDPYAPYNKREEFYATRSKPRPLPDGVTFESNV